MPAQFESDDAIAEAILETVGKKVVLALPLGLGKANHVANALYRRAADDSSIQLTIFTALTLEKPAASSVLGRRFIDPVIERLFGNYPDLLYARALHAGTLPKNIQVNEFFFLAGRWLSVKTAQQHYISANYTHAARYVMERGVNVIAQLVAKRVVTGQPRYSLSCNPDLTLDLLKARQAGKTNFCLVAQVNSELPFMPGDSDLPPNVFSHVLENEATDFPLFAPPKEPVSLSEHAVGLHVARLVPDGGTLQIGIGQEGDAAAHALILRHRDNTAFRNAVTTLSSNEEHRGLCHDEPFATGLYGVSEMLVDPFLKLIEAGVIKRQVEGALVHGAFFLGPKSFYRALREMNEVELSRLKMKAVSFTNDIYDDTEAKRRSRVGARFINSAMMVTLLGAVVSDGLDSGLVVSGVGGQYNFASQAFALEGARLIIALKATRDSAGKLESNIRWSYGHETLPRHLRDIVVTEYGIADLRGKSDRDVIVAMLAICDSRFQGELIQKAKKAGKLEASYEIPPTHRSNTPERIRTAMAPFGQSNLLPQYPFGTDFTETEQRLIPALAHIQFLSRSPLRLFGLAFAALRTRTISKEDTACLARMELASPRSIPDHFYRALLLSALSKA